MFILIHSRNRNGVLHPYSFFEKDKQEKETKNNKHWVLADEILHQQKLQLVYSFRLIIYFLFKIYIIQITFISSVSELSTTPWCSLLGSGADVLALILGSMLVQLTRLCPICLQFE